MLSEYRRLLGLQGAIVVAGAIISSFAASFPAAMAFAFGSCIVLASSAFFVWRFQQGARHTQNESSGRDANAANAEWYLRQAYRTAIERFIWVAGMLVVGFKLLELKPFWMLAGFLGGQVIWLVAPIWMRVEKVK
ncbi:MAG: ATP synthase subunit I [Burkholderiales bacterium]|jgi:hypothetical protein|nr:ATP synthase subunit I [Burkholderiales bacterium]